MHFHIGHHFYGSGNIGDDWMLAGFFAALDAAGAVATFACPTPFDRAALTRRFSRVEWLPYDPAVRTASIARADAWLGLGDTPFQSDTGRWFLDHLDWERSQCEALRTPMWFLGVGANDRGVFEHDVTRRVAQASERIWARDASSARWTADAAGSERVELGADLSHVFFAATASRAESHPQSPAPLALCLNFEDRTAFDVAAIGRLVATHKGASWLVQEIRPLEWAEQTLLAMLDKSVRSRLIVVAPDYARDTPEAMLDRWPTPRAAVVSRYHAATALAWRGVPTVAVTRNDKLRGLVDDLGLEGIDSLVDTCSAEVALGRAVPVSPAALVARAHRAQRMVEQWAQAAGLLPPRSFLGGGY